MEANAHKTPTSFALAGIVACASHAASAQTAAPPMVTLPTPQMEGSLAFSAPPVSFDTGPLGRWYVSGVLSGLGLVQSSPEATDKSGLGDLSNAQLMVQKIDGLVQFYVQAGTYAIPALGMPYAHLANSADALHNDFSALPQGFLKIAPSDAFSIEAGKLPTLIGPESAFDFENFNVERGLLWNQTNSVNRGAQVNYTAGPVAFSLSLNDGYYSDRYDWLSGSVTWTIDKANTLLFDAGANLGRTGYSSVANPLFQNNGAIGDLVYTYSKAPLIVTPYLQYSHVDRKVSIGIPRSADTYGGAVLADYAFTPRWQLAGRVEYIKSDGGGRDSLSPTNLLYGAGSGAFSFTVTPTFTYKRFFLRADGAVVHVTELVMGEGFGRDGHAATQMRGVLEGGIIF